MKRYLFIIVAVLLSIGLVACSGDEVEKKEVDNVDLDEQEEEVAAEEDESETDQDEEEEDIDRKSVV